MKISSALFFGRFVKAIAVGVALGFCFITPVTADEVFEGRVKMKMTDGREKQTLDYFVKGDRMRVAVEDPRAQGGVMILNTKEKKMMMLMPAQKMYMTMALPEIKGEDSDQQKPEPTGETRTILGYSAKQYLIKEGGSDFEIWATDELGRFAGLHLGNGRSGASSPTDRALAGQEFFPLLIIERKNGREGTRVEVTEVERKELPDSLFQPPPDFRGMEMPFQLPR